MTLEAGSPKWRRRKEARPAEIVAAAMAVFSEKGFAAARLDDIAARAGVSKGALYLYFETKQALFEAVVRDIVGPNVTMVIGLIDQFPGSFADLARLVLPTAAARLVASDAGKVVKMIVGESRTFPELAAYWHREVITPALGAMRRRVERAQAEGELIAGDSRYMAYSLIAPMLLGLIWREVMEPIGAEPVELDRLAAQHAEILLGGMLVRAEAPNA